MGTIKGLSMFKDGVLFPLSHTEQSLPKLQIYNEFMLFIICLFCPTL